VTPPGGKRRAGGRGRLAALVLLPAAIAGGAVLGTRGGSHPPVTALQPAALAAEAAPAASTSSVWYCPAGPGEAAGTTHVLLANAAGKAVRVGIVVVDARGARHRVSLRLGPHSQSDIVPGQLVHGAWLASRVDVAGGAVSATELVDGRSGRAVAPCASEVSPRWYFAAGSTLGGSTLSATLFNPTPNLAVVDLSFVTAFGFTAPAPFQGLVVAPGTLRTLTVGAYVQNQGTIATVVDARSGAVVAGELQLFGPGGKAGVALSLGAPTTSARWELPSVEDANGGASALTVFNPTSSAEHVALDVRFPTGPVAPFSQTLGPRSVWTLATSQQLRVASQVPYTVDVRATGPGVVVGRTGAGGRGSPAPWWASDVTVSALETTAADRWLVTALPAVPQPATTAVLSGRVTGTLRQPAALVVENPARRGIPVEVEWWTRSGRRHLRRFLVPAYGRTTLTAPDGPAVVQSNGPVAVMGDASPSGTAGVVGIPAVPLR
jgi:acyl-coenzyme A thioesterase PaaI-like protein